MEIIIENSKTEKNYWKDVFRYRQLFFFMAWKEFLIRYKQTIMGLSWSVVRPILTMIVFTFIFGNVAKMPSSGVPYQILVYSGLLPWQFFTESFTHSSNSLIQNNNLISKVYFPRIIIPASSIFVSLVDFTISFAVFCLLMLVYGFMPSINILLIPLFVILTAIIAYGVGLFFATLNVKYRDVKYVVPFVVQMGLYISPVGFSASVIPAKWKFVYSLNPMVGIIDGFRWAIIGGEFRLNIQALITTTILAIALLGTSLLFFRKSEKKFADVI